VPRHGQRPWEHGMVGAITSPRAADGSSLPMFSVAVTFSLLLRDVLVAGVAPWEDAAADDTGAQSVLVLCVPTGDDPPPDPPALGALEAGCGRGTCPACLPVGSRCLLPACAAPPPKQRARARAHACARGVRPGRSVAEGAGLIESRWVSKPLALAGEKHPRRLNKTAELVSRWGAAAACRLLQRWCRGGAGAGGGIHLRRARDGARRLRDELGPRRCARGRRAVPGAGAPAGAGGGDRAVRARAHAHARRLAQGRGRAGTGEGEGWHRGGGGLAQGRGRGSGSGCSAPRA
jgi:hypothetical protein